MKYADYNIDNNKLEIINSISGIEIIKLNQRIVSKGFSFFGKNHFFKIGEDQYTVKLYVTLKNYTGVGFSIFKNGQQVYFENQLSKLDKRNLMIWTVLSIVIGLVVGLGFAFLATEVLDVLLVS